MGTQHFFTEGRYLGQRTISDNRVVPGLEIRPHFSYVMFCGICGEIWGRVLHDKARYTQIISRSCLKHGDGRLSCPLIWEDDPTRFEFNWPSDAVRREFEATLKYEERRMGLCR